MLEENVKLNNGREMPKIGLGTWQLTDPKKLERVIRYAISIGYRHIDTAHIYGNEKLLGEVLKKIFKEGIIKRVDLFITSKLWNTFHKNPEVGLKTTLQDLQLDYLDLYLIHWPVTFETDEDFRPKIKDEKTVIGEFDTKFVWEQMESFVERGLVRSIGCGNFGRKNTDKILSFCKIKPAMIQIEIHPYLTQHALVDYFHSKNICVTSYSSLGSSGDTKDKVRHDPEILKIAQKYKKTVPQVILSYLSMRNLFLIPKSESEDHIKENRELFKLSQEDFKKIDDLNKNLRYVDLPEWGGKRFD